ncbi:MAG: hypothetical protein EXR77_08980 [Myxococcales bacterium]|nr:hypothetical protein [Myxococcales bacterium]
MTSANCRSLFLVVVLSLLCALIGVRCTTEAISAKASAAADSAKAAAQAKADAFATKIANDVLDDLVCSGKISSQLADRLKAKISEKGGVSVSDLLSAPEMLSDVYARTTGSLAGLLSTLSAVKELLQVPVAKEVIAKGWDSAACGPAVPIPCLGGTGAVTVTCDGAKVGGVAVALNACKLPSGTYSGAVTLARIATDTGAAEVALTAVKIGDALQLDGKVRLKVSVGDNLGLDLRALSALTMASNQTGSAKAKCGTKTILSVVHLAADTTQLVAEFEGVRQNPDASYSFRSSGKHLFWPYADACPCPGVGAGLEVTFPAPYGKGAGPTLNLVFGAPSATDSCASVKATLANWPACSKTENLTTDCGRAAGENLAVAVFAAVCGKGL